MRINKEKKGECTPKVSMRNTFGVHWKVRRKCQPTLTSTELSDSTDTASESTEADPVDSPPTDASPCGVSTLPEPSAPPVAEAPSEPTEPELSVEEQIFKLAEQVVVAQTAIDFLLMGGM